MREREREGGREKGREGERERGRERASHLCELLNSLNLEVIKGSFDTHGRTSARE